MRRINKGPEPEELRRWKEMNAATPQNLTYANMPKRGAKSQMLVEQGYLCAYTMERIQGADDCQVEHIVPRSQLSQPPYNEIAYDNLLLASPATRLVTDH